MKHLFLAFILICSTYSFGQKTNFPISVSEKIAGKNLQNDLDIKGTEYTFPNKIHKVFLDTVSGFWTIQLRGTSKNGKWLNNTGHVLQYNPNEQKLIWNKKINYLTSELLQDNNVMIHTVGNKSSYLDIYTGKELWKAKNSIYHIDPINRIGIGYKSKNNLEGIAFMGHRQINFGNPFIAAFDRETGDQIFLSIMDEKKDPILSSQLMGDKILLTFKDRLEKYSKKTGEFIMARIFQKNEFGELKSFIENHAFIVNENDEFINLRQTDTTKIFVLTNKGSVLAMDDKFNNITNTIKQEDLNFCYLETENYKFIAKYNGNEDGYRTWLIDNSGKKIAEMEVSSAAFLINKTLYDLQKDKLVAINLEGIIEQ